MAILSKGCKPDKLEPYNSLKLSFMNIQGLHSNFVECQSFLWSNSLDILALYETNLDDSIDSGNFSARGYLPLIRKGSITHTHGLAVYVKEGIPFAWDLSLENSADSYLCFCLALLHSVSYFFVVIHSFDSIWSNSSDSNFLSSNASICSIIVFPPLRNCDHVVVSVSIDFDPITYDYSHADLDGLHIIWEMFHGTITLNSVLVLLLVNFVKWVQFGIDVYIAHWKYQVKPHPHGFQLLVLLPKIIEIIFFVCTNRINLLNLKQSSDRLVIVAKRFLMLPNLHMLLKQKNPSLCRNLVLGTFGELLTLFSTKVNLLYLFY